MTDNDPEKLAAELELLQAEIEALDATASEKGVVRLSGDLGGTADAPTVPALDEIEELREKRANLLEGRRKATAAEATSVREDTAAEVERLREQQRLKVESRRAQIAAEVESGRIRDEREAAQTREDLAGQLSYERGQESARIDSRLGWHDQQFERINGSVRDCATAIEEQNEQLVGLRLEMNNRFAEQVQAALKAEKMAQQLAADGKRDGRRLMLQIASAVLVACITSGAGIVGVLLSSSP